MHHTSWVVPLIFVVCLIAWGIFLLWAHTVFNVTLFLFEAFASGGGH